MKRPEDTVKEEGAAMPDEKWAKSLPTLCEYLVTTEWEGGGAREPSTLVLKVQNGCILAAVNDVALKRSLYVSGDTVEATLKSMEKALQSPTADWRKWGSKKK